MVVREKNVSAVAGWTSLALSHYFGFRTLPLFNYDHLAHEGSLRTETQSFILDLHMKSQLYICH
jgi:hypothetical protein